jgi:hypothetical protein
VGVDEGGGAVLDAEENKIVIKRTMRKKEGAKREGRRKEGR